MRNGPGFTLAECIIASSLAALVLIALVSLVGPLFRAQISLYRQQRSQGETLLAAKNLGLALRQASELYSPGPGGAGDVISGCSNYSSRLGAGAAGLIDAGLPAGSFYFCEKDGTLYHHTATGSPPPCPLAPSCGIGAAVVAVRVSHQPGRPNYFKRPSNQNVVEAHFQVSGMGATQAVDAGFAILAAAGANQ